MIEVHDSVILIIDDEPAITRLLERILLGAGYLQVHRVTDPTAAVPICAELSPDLVLLDLHMPDLNGFEVLERLGPMVRDGGELPVVVMSGDPDRAACHQALRLGARDFISKPFDGTEVVLRVQNLLTTRILQRGLRNEKQMLECELETGSRKLEQTRFEAIRHLALAAALRDEETGCHTERVGRSAAALGCLLGLDPELVSRLRVAAPLHDVGKIGIPDEILRKPGRLTREEFAVMKTHTTLGGAILADSEIPELTLAHEIALSHHERWDGTGYPMGLRGEEIPISGRLVAVADVFDALVHRRPYKPAWPVPEAVREIRAQSGAQFDPAVVDAFLQLDHAALARGEERPGAIGPAQSL